MLLDLQLIVHILINNEGGGETQGRENRAEE